jgi:hypothetical protein
MRAVCAQGVCAVCVRGVCAGCIRGVCAGCMRGVYGVCARGVAVRARGVCARCVCAVCVGEVCARGVCAGCMRGECAVCVRCVCAVCVRGVCAGLTARTSAASAVTWSSKRLMVYLERGGREIDREGGREGGREGEKERAREREGTRGNTKRLGMREIKASIYLLPSHLYTPRPLATVYPLASESLPSRISKRSRYRAVAEPLQNCHRAVPEPFQSRYRAVTEPTCVLNLSRRRHLEDHYAGDVCSMRGRVQQEGTCAGEGDVRRRRRSAQLEGTCAGVRSRTGQ